MENFFDTVETIEDSVGFTYYDTCHLFWLASFALFVVIGCISYRKCTVRGRNVWKKALAAALVADELFKVICLLATGNYLLKYLPLHLCSINIILIAIHAFRPTKLLGNFLYMICIPAAIAALLFPTWTALPAGNFMHIHSFTVHILLAAYPIILTCGGDIRPEINCIPKCLVLLAAMAIPIYFFNLLFGTNFMFLMYAEIGNPLLWFEQNMGSHLIGYPVLLIAVIAVMYLPWQIIKRQRKREHQIESAK